MNCVAIPIIILMSTKGNLYGTWGLNYVQLRYVTRAFFNMDEHIDAKASKEKSSTTILTVISGELTSKKIEMELRNIVSSGIWKWNARQIAENKFSMRFPTAKMVEKYRKFKFGTKNVDALILIEPWNSAMGAKGEL